MCLKLVSDNWSVAWRWSWTCYCSVSAALMLELRICRRAQPHMVSCALSPALPPPFPPSLPPSQNSIIFPLFFPFVYFVFAFTSLRIQSLLCPTLWARLLGMSELPGRILDCRCFNCWMQTMGFVCWWAWESRVCWDFLLTFLLHHRQPWKHNILTLPTFQMWTWWG